VGAQDSGWELKVQGGSSRFRVGAQGSGWELKIQGVGFQNEGLG